jgi:hypothetical protein
MNRPLTPAEALATFTPEADALLNAQKRGLLSPRSTLAASEGMGVSDNPYCNDADCNEPNSRAMRWHNSLVSGSALDVQVAGSHYKDKKIQPVEYIHANGLGFLEGCIVKRITRWRDKPAASRFQDLEKIKHEVDLLIELESRT